MQDYLETKRIAFPRFYFVAPADLLDILSKGSNPQLILRHLSKCFDNVHNLSFKPHEITGEPTKVILCLYLLGAYNRNAMYTRAKAGSAPTVSEEVACMAKLT